MRSSSARLFGASLLALYFEMVAIRYFPAYINLLAYFSNFVLLACFLGLGAGCLLARRKTSLLAYFPWILLFLLLLLKFTYIQIDANFSTDVYFTVMGAPKGLTLLKGDASWLLPLCFVGFTFLFLPLGQALGAAFQGLQPLRAYTLNIVGSLLGVGAFMLLSALGVRPWIWFLAAFSLLFFLVPRRIRAAVFVGAVLNVGLVWLLDSPQDFWSPYYRVSLSRDVIFVNGIPHQMMIRDAPLNETLYRVLMPVRKRPFRRVLILGAGTGNDVVHALKYSTGNVDAVEIDPTIARMGRLHPAQPYADPRVRLHIEDARQFLERGHETYDLIIFAAIDSLTALTHFSTVRLESFVFTRESFEKVKERLAPDGLVVLFNYYRKPWIISRLYHMLADEFLEARLKVISEEDHIAVLVSGPGLKALNLSEPEKNPEFYKRVVPTSDSWPFPYLHHPSLPRHYQIALILVFLFGLLMARACLGSWTRFITPYFFMGAGFMLLETSAIVRLGLLFGSTWRVTAVAVCCVLLAILVANAIVAYLGNTVTRWVYPLLFAFLAAVGLPLRWFLGFSGGTLIYCAILFLAMIACGILFAALFSRSKNASADLGANLVGGLAGGLLEYSSLLWGYPALVVLAVGLYIAVWFLARR